MFDHKPRHAVAPQVLARSNRRRLATCWLAAAVVAFCFTDAASTAAGEEDNADAKLTQALHAALKEANPEYQNGGTFTIRGSKLVAINLMRCKGVSDLSPLSKFPLDSVTSVNLYNAVNIADLSPLSGCRLTSLNLERCGKIRDLAPLKGMPLTWLRMYACPQIGDLSPLAGMPLEHLDIGLNPLVSDLAPLAGMRLHDLRIDNCPRIKDISVLKDMPLTFLSVFGCPKIESYAPLASLKLETLYFDPARLSPDELQHVRNMQSLKKIGTSWADYKKELSPEQFWKQRPDQK